MARGRSLRSVARELGYSPSTLSKHLRNGVFRKLPQGGFDIDHVRRGLLSGTSPNQTHSVKLAAKLPKSEHLAPKARTPAPGISAQYVPPIIGYEDEDEEPVELPQRGRRSGCNGAPPGRQGSSGNQCLVRAADQDGCGYDEARQRSQSSRRNELL
jgi:hypothetical protein